MSQTTLKTKILLCNDTSANWASSEKVLLKGEVGIEFIEDGTPKIKIGDGEKSFRELQYVAMTPKEIQDLINSVDTQLQETITNSIKSEADTREATDSALGEQIEQETAARESADTELQQKVESETSARESADTALGERITQESNNRQTAVDKKVNIDGGDVSDTVAEFIEAGSRTNIASGEHLNAIFGKIKKWFTDFHNVAFSGNYTDLSNKPTSLKNPSPLTIRQNSTSGGTSYDGSSAVTVNITPSGISAAPTSHATNATTYGKGDGSNYGHLKLSDSTASTSSTTGGIAATPKAVKDAYDLAANKARTATFVVAASNSSTKSKGAADYVCDGTSDQTEINNAISALPSGGGMVLFLEGTYNISGSITLNKANVTLEGMGRSTIIRRSTSSSITIMSITASNVIIQNLKVDGNKSSYSISGYPTCVAINGSSPTVTNCEICGYGFGIAINIAESETLITNNHIHDLTGNGIQGSNYGKIIISDNIIQKCDSRGISDIKESSITGNYISNTLSGINVKNNNIITGNYCVDGAGEESVVLDGAQNLVIGNMCLSTGSGYAITVKNSAKDCVVVGNILGGDILSSSSTLQDNNRLV